MKFKDGFKTAFSVYQSTALMIEMNHCGIWEIKNFPTGIPDALTIISIDMIKHAFV